MDGRDAFILSELEDALRALQTVPSHDWTRAYATVYAGTRRIRPASSRHIVGGIGVDALHARCLAMGTRDHIIEGAGL